jgi:hypothetical protein
LVLLSFTDDHDAAHGYPGDYLPHRVDGGLVAAVLVAPAGPPRCGHGRRFGDPHQVEAEVVIGELINVELQAS